MSEAWGGIIFVVLLLCLFYLGLLAIAVIGMVIEKIDAIRHRYITLS